MMIFTAKLVTLAAFVAMAVVQSNGDDRERTIRLRRSSGSGLPAALSSAISGNGRGAARDSRSASSPEDFVSGLGHSSGLVYGPGLGLSSISRRNASSALRERDLATAASSASLTGGHRVGAREGVTARTTAVPTSGDLKSVAVDRPAGPVPCLQVPVDGPAPASLRVPVPVDGPASASLLHPVQVVLHDAPVQIGHVVVDDPLQIALGLRTAADFGRHFGFGLDVAAASAFDYGSSAAAAAAVDNLYDAGEPVDQQVLYFTAYGSGLQGFDYYNN